ncbi:winged helix-turn-helix domain-containing protein [Pseudoruegeria sp. HB172150]|uniref:winged helix-turn-helix domain-containing protein n=1 Tax=Pseudoruegeria sp. HB172150 TaxID=2721164 RepID=UPI0015541B99|nr:winged helix-turn-helix domain-containing protein [Pseudoruegeria sp. HB172150]
MVIQFGACLLDIDRRVLERHGAPVHLEPQVFALLTYLVENSDRAVTKDELFDNIWDGRAVSDAVLTSRIRSLRRAIDDPGAASHIRTIHRVGYQFRTRVRQSNPSASASTPDTSALPGTSDTAQAEELRHVVVLAVQPRLRLDRDYDADAFDEVLIRVRDRLVAHLSPDDRWLTGADGSIYALLGAVRAHSDDLLRAARIALTVAEADDPSVADAAVGICAGTVARAGDSYRGRPMLLAGQHVSRVSGGKVGLSKSDTALYGDAAQFDMSGEVAVLLDLDESTETREAAPPLIGRMVEIGLIEGAVAATIDKLSGGSITLQGDAGVGKTRIAARAAAMINRTGGRHSTVYLRELAAPGALYRGIFRGLTDLIPDAEALRKAAPKRLQPQLDVILSGKTSLLPMRHDPVLTETVLSILREISRDRSLLIVVEDAHWIDDDSRQLALRLAEEAPDMQVILLITARPSAQPFLEEIAERAQGDIVALSVGPLSPRNARSLIEALDKRIDDDTAEGLIRRAAGNPLFLTRLVEAYRRQGPAVLERVPESVQSVVQIQFDQLSPGDQSLLRQLSVLGERFQPEIARHVLGEEADQLRPVAGFLKQSSQWISFTHNLVHESIYLSLPRKQREQLHTEAAQALVSFDPLLAAEHAMRGDLAIAPEICLQLARDTFNFRRHARSVELIERATQLDCAPDLRAQLEIFLGSAQLELGDEARAHAYYEAALGRAETALPAVFALTRIARIHARHFRLEEAEAAMKEADAWTEREQGPGYLKSEIAEIRAANAWLDRNPEKAREAAELAVDLADHPHPKARALNSLAWAHFSLGHFRTAAQVSETCLDLIDTNELRLVESYVLGPHLRFAWYTNPGHERLVDAHTVVERADRLGIAAPRIEARCARLEITWELGETDILREDLNALDEENAQLDLLSFATARFFEALDDLGSGRRPDLARIDAALAVARFPAFLPLNWLRARLSESEFASDQQPSTLERLWLLRLTGQDLLDQDSKLVSRDPDENLNWRAFAATQAPRLKAVLDKIGN